MSGCLKVSSKLVDRRPYGGDTGPIYLLLAVVREWTYLTSLPLSVLSYVWAVKKMHDWMLQLNICSGSGFFGQVWHLSRITSCRKW